MHTFLLILSGQIVSLIGSHITAFAVSAWIFQRTGSVAHYSLIVLSHLLPPIVVAPLAGTLADAWDKRKLLLLAHLGGAVCSLALLLLFRSGHFETRWIVPLLIATSAFNTLEVPVVSASTSILVPPGQLVRANGLREVGGAAAQLCAPVVSGLLLSTVGLGPIFVLDVVSFLFAACALLFVRIPRPPGAPPPPRDPGAFLRDAAAGARYVRGHAGLRALLLYSAVVRFHLGMLQILFSPLILGIASVRTLGIIDSVGGLGMLAGSGLMALTGGPRRRIHGVLGFTLLQGIVLLVAVARPSAYLAGFGSFCVLFAMPAIASCGETLWQRTVPVELQGRTAALRMVLGNIVLALSSVLAGPLADRVFQPLLSAGSRFAEPLGRLVGPGPGRGAALLIAVLGIDIILATGLARMYAPLRRIEDGLGRS
jgi:DHA3 family macrolide efflux protein-like MFS transporter